MAILIQASSVGSDAGPFNLFSQVNGFTESFETGITSLQLLVGFVSYNVPAGTTVVRIQSSNDDCNSFVDEPIDTPPVCPNTVPVFQICNTNSSMDDNFNILLNGVTIGSVDLSQNAQVGAVFIASTTPVTLTEPNFPCPLGGMQLFFFDPALISYRNHIEMVNTQNNGNGNLGNLTISNYDLAGSILSNPCLVDTFQFSGSSGDNFSFTWIYDQCCQSQPLP
jgi:hypothetical protein